MNRIAAGAVALVLAILLAGCAQQRLASQCRWADDEGFLRYGGCTTGKPGEYILVVRPKDNEVNIINEVYGQYGIKSIKELKPTAFNIYGASSCPCFLVVLTDDPGHQKMYELSRKASPLFGPTYISVTPNYNHY